jgi:acyl carrier protein
MPDPITPERVAESVRSYIGREVLQGPVDGFDDDSSLLELGAIDSISLVGLLQHIETEFRVAFAPAEVTPANFRTVRAIASAVVDRAPGASR